MTIVEGSHIVHVAAFTLIFLYLTEEWGTAVAQWLSCCTTNRKVAGSIAAGIIGILH